MDELKGSQPSPGLSRNEKLGFIGLIVLAISIIYLGFRQMGNVIKGPFASRMAASLAQPKEAELNEAEQMAVLKQKDTDKDGLSDYDELYLYQTSPYLADTDSDGISDKTEIEKNTDPNCPQGKDCLGSSSTALVGEIATSTMGLGVGQMPSADQILLQSLFGENPDPKTLREFLLKQGVDKKTLESFDDAELLQTFKELVSATSAPVLTAPLAPVPDFSELNAKDLRDLLRQQGVSEEALKKISDEELMEMVKEIK